MVVFWVCRGVLPALPTTSLPWSLLPGGPPALPTKLREGSGSSLSGFPYIKVENVLLYAKRDASLAKKPKKSEEIVIEQVVEVPEVPVAPEEPMIPAPKESLFDDLDAQGAPSELAVRPSDDIRPLDADLSADEKEVFKKLLDEAMPLAERARRLVNLARLKGSKTAGVGLRALQEINSLTGVNREADAGASPMFALPAGTEVSVTVKKVDR